MYYNYPDQKTFKLRFIFDKLLQIVALMQTFNIHQKKQKTKQIIKVSIMLLAWGGIVTRSQCSDRTAFLLKISLLMFCPNSERL